MWSVWGILALSVMGLKVYTDRLCRDEDDQLVLADSFSRVRTEQEEICAKVHKLEPLRKASLWLFVAATVFVIGYYVMDFVTQFK